jgi:hypothetical protein
VGKSGFYGLVGPLRQVPWPEKFKADNIDWYDGSNNPEEFIQVYQIIIEAARGDNRVEANFMPMTILGYQLARRIYYFLGSAMCHIH